MPHDESIRSMPPVEAARRGLGELADEYPDLAGPRSGWFSRASLRRRQCPRVRESPAAQGPRACDQEAGRGGRLRLGGRLIPSGRRRMQQPGPLRALPVKPVLAALAVLAAAVSVSCGDGEPPGPVSPSVQPPPAAAETQPPDPPERVRERPKHPPPPVNHVPPLSDPTVSGFLLDSSVVVAGSPITTGKFRVTDLVADRFEDDGEAPRTITVRMPDQSWEPGRHKPTPPLEPGVEYLLFLQPGDSGYRVTVHYPWGPDGPGDPLATRHAGIFEIDEHGILRYRPGGLGSNGLSYRRLTADVIREADSARPSWVGRRLRGEPPPHGYYQSP